METITTWKGERKEFNNFGDFLDTKNEIHKTQNAGFVSYYDNNGGTHVCEFVVVRGGVSCLGLWCDLKGKDAYDHTRKHFSLDTYKAAKEIVQYECDDFLGWSL